MRLVLTDGPLLLAVGAIWVWVPGGHPAVPAAAVAGFVAYALACRVGLPLAAGVAGVTQPAFVLMLFSVPLNAVPAVVLAASLVGNLRPPLRLLPMALGDSWFSVAPVMVLAALAPGAAAWSDWPVYGTVFAAQFAADAVLAGTRRRLLGHASAMEWRTVATPVVVDCLLVPVGIAAAVEAPHAPGAAAAITFSVLGLTVLLGRERKSRLAHQHRSLHDPLTGAANRALFGELLEAAIRRAGRTGAGGALLIIDLDDFKAINDTQGHQRGDQVLCAVAERLRRCLRHADTVARIGGDEFAVLLAEPCAVSDAEAVAAKIRAAFELPLMAGDTEMIVTTSVGATPLGPAVSSAEDLLADADQRMYVDKSRAGLAANRRPHRSP